MHTDDPALLTATSPAAVPRKPAGQKCHAGLSVASGSEPTCCLAQRWILGIWLPLLCFTFDNLTVGLLHGINLRAKSPNEWEVQVCCMLSF